MAQKAGQAPVHNPMSSEEIRARVTSGIESETQLAEELRQKTELLKLSREAVLVVDLSDKIAFWSDGAEQLYGWKRAEAIGKSPLELLQTQLPRPVAQIETILRREPHWEGELKQITRFGARISVSSRWALWRDLSGRTLGRFQLDSDITRRKNVEQELRILSGRLLTIRDEERRRWARELHDSVGQLLVGITMNLSILQRQLDGAAPIDSKFLSESMLLTNEALQEIRTLSYLLHPPMLEDAGLEAALRGHLDNFSEGTDIAVTLEADGLGRLPADVELTVFRVVEEALANVKQHSGSTTARVSVQRDLGSAGDGVLVAIEDAGRGMSRMANMATLVQRLTATTADWGLGLTLMRERVQRVGGTLEITSTHGGSIVRASLPVPHEKAHRTALILG